MLQKSKRHLYQMGVAFVGFMGFLHLMWTPWLQKGYVTWVTTSEMHIAPKIVIGVVLIGLFGWLARMAFRAKGVIGTLIFVALGALFVYWGIDTGTLPVALDPLVEVAYISLSVMLAFGLRSAKLGRDISGQVHTEDPDTVSNDD